MPSNWQLVSDQHLTRATSTFITPNRFSTHKFTTLYHHGARTCDGCCSYVLEPFETKGGGRRKAGAAARGQPRSFLHVSHQVSIDMGDVQEGGSKLLDWCELNTHTTSPWCQTTVSKRHSVMSHYCSHPFSSIICWLLFKLVAKDRVP
jgi:hypothetical protein